MSDISTQLEMRHSTSAIVDIPEPRYMTVVHFCATYKAAISEVEIVGIQGKQFVDLDNTKAKMLMLRARFS